MKKNENKKQLERKKHQKFETSKIKKRSGSDKRKNAYSVKKRTRKAKQDEK